MAGRGNEHALPSSFQASFHGQIPPGLFSPAPIPPIHTRCDVTRGGMCWNPSRSNFRIFFRLHWPLLSLAPPTTVTAQQHRTPCLCTEREGSGLPGGGRSTCERPKQRSGCTRRGTLTKSSCTASFFAVPHCDVLQFRSAWWEFWRSLHVASVI